MKRIACLTLCAVLGCRDATGTSRIGGDPLASVGGAYQLRARAAYDTITKGMVSYPVPFELAYSATASVLVADGALSLNGGTFTRAHTFKTAPINGGAPTFSGVMQNGSYSANTTGTVLEFRFTALDGSIAYLHGVVSGNRITVSPKTSSAGTVLVYEQWVYER